MTWTRTHNLRMKRQVFYHSTTAAGLWYIVSDLVRVILVAHCLGNSRKSLFFLIPKSKKYIKQIIMTWIRTLNPGMKRQVFYHSATAAGLWYIVSDLVRVILAAQCLGNSRKSHFYLNPKSKKYIKQIKMTWTRTHNLRMKRQVFYHSSTAAGLWYIVSDLVRIVSAAHSLGNSRKRYFYLIPKSKKIYQTNHPDLD
jgi:hypothetical protein